VHGWKLKKGRQDDTYRGTLRVVLSVTFPSPWTSFKVTIFIVVSSLLFFGIHVWSYSLADGVLRWFLCTKMDAATTKREVRSVYENCSVAVLCRREKYWKQAAGSVQGAE
jgi:hypothetical protein